VSLGAGFEALSKVHSIISIPPHRGSPGLPEGLAPLVLLIFTTAAKQSCTQAPATFPGRTAHTARPLWPLGVPSTARQAPVAQADSIEALHPTGSSCSFTHRTGMVRQISSQDPSVQHPWATHGWSKQDAFWRKNAHYFVRT
jgi:hypothetical protein